ncbi:cytochrome c3 family protein [Gaetbulibacter aquiaggeris]|uniref:Cytochrome c3 family protein n=1 Tax=Gaetbulibacter aquiaggeris TaxID=1735373 RepID=A0ABW7MSE9_9FLAO
MKTTKNLLTLAFAMFATFAFAQSVVGTAHDLSGATWNTGTDEVCITCHTPHNAISANGPLWNHTESVADYTLYSSTVSSTFDSDATITQPAGTSKLCLGCHDGTVDLANYGQTTDATGNAITGTALLGTNLTTHHPVSFTYNTALFTADGGLYDPAVTTAVSTLLFGDNVECASCHNAHDDTNGAFLVMSNSASALCLTCHNK